MKAKSFDSHTVPLSSAAVAILKAIKPAGAKPTDSVFPGVGTDHERQFRKAAALPSRPWRPRWARTCHA
jgi:hypothetical protein